MNLLYGELTEIFAENGMRFGKARVGKVWTKVALELLADAARGDRVFICDGVALAKMRDAPESEEKYVSGHTR